MIYTEPKHGTASIENGNVIKYKPDMNYEGDDAFSILVSNGHDALLIEYKVKVVNSNVNIYKEHMWYIRGYEDNTVRPEGIVTREELATILYRIDTDSQEVYVDPVMSYSDVDSNRWSYRAIMYLTNLNVLTGYPDGTFKPVQTMTRAELAAVVSRYAKLDSQTIVPYHDINEGHWAREAIAKVTARGFFTDDDNGAFGPEEPLQRGYTTRVINRLLERNDSTAYVDDNPFTDLPTSHPYYHSMVEAFTYHTTVTDSRGVEIWQDHSYPWQ
jgi:hypothetical protein